MEPSSDPGTEPVLGEGHYTVVLAGAGHRTLEVTRAAHFRAGPFIVSYFAVPTTGATTGPSPTTGAATDPDERGPCAGSSTGPLRIGQRHTLAPVNLLPAFGSVEHDTGRAKRTGAHRRLQPSRQVRRPPDDTPSGAAFLARFELQVDPDRTLPESERLRRAEAARKAYFHRLAAKSAAARRGSNAASTRPSSGT